MKRQKRAGDPGSKEQQPQVSPQKPDDKPFWQWTPLPEHRMRVLALVDLRKMNASDISAPLIVTDVDPLTSIAKGDENFKKEMHDKGNSFRVRPDKSNGQFHGKFQDKSVEAQIEKTMREECFPMCADVGGVLLPAEAEVLQHVMKADVWIRGANSDTFGIEQAALTCVRYNFSGARTIVAAPFAELGGFVR
eukprot:2366901-Pyramimonas_sp.AAC.1